MSFGFSIGDFMNLVQLTTRTYQGWKKACGEYTDITQELDNLNILLSRAAAEIEVPSSLLLHQDRDLDQLKALTSSCTAIVSQLESIVLSYGGLSKSRRSTWDRIRFGQQNLTGLRVKLILQINTLGTYLDIVGISAIGRVEDNVRELPKMIKVIDSLAAEIRAGRREGSAMTTYENDEKEVWRQFRRELIAEGFSSEDLKRSRSHLRRYIKRVAKAGLLDEETPKDDGDVPCATDEEHSNATAVTKTEQSDVLAKPPSMPHTSDLGKASRPDFDHSIVVEIEGVGNGTSNTGGANLSEYVARIPGSVRQEYAVQPPIASAWVEDSLPHVNFDGNSQASKEHFKSVGESSYEAEDSDVEQTAFHKRKDGQRADTESVRKKDAVRGDSKMAEEREHRKKQRHYQTNTAVGNSSRSFDIASGKTSGSKAGAIRRQQQTYKMPSQEDCQDYNPDSIQTIPRGNARHISAEQELLLKRNQSSTGNHFGPGLETKHTPGNGVCRETSRSIDGAHDTIHNPPYPDRLRRKKGQEFGERDRLNFLKNHLKKGMPSKEGVIVEKDAKSQKDGPSKSKRRGLEEHEKQHPLEKKDLENDLLYEVFLPQPSMPSRPSSRQASTRDKHRPKVYKVVHPSSYYEDIEIPTPISPLHPSESMRRTPRLRRAKTTPISKFPPAQNNPIQVSREHTTISQAEIARAATAPPLKSSSHVKDEVLLPRRKHSLSKVARLLSPKPESSLPKRKFSLPGLVFQRRESEEPHLRTVRSSRSHVDSRAVSTPSPLQRHQKTRA